MIEPVAGRPIIQISVLNGRRHDGCRQYAVGSLAYERLNHHPVGMACGTVNQINGAVPFCKCCIFPAAREIEPQP